MAVFGEDTPLSLIERIKPSVLVKGGDYTREQVVGHDVVEAAGGEVMLVPTVQGFSTTSLVERAREVGHLDGGEVQAERHRQGQRKLDGGNAAPILPDAGSRMFHGTGFHGTGSFSNTAVLSSSSVLLPIAEASIENSHGRW